MLETLVYLEVRQQDLPGRYHLLKVEVESRIDFKQIDRGELPADWQTRPQQTQALGDTWLKKCRECLLRVPSAIMPETFNWLLNPKHRDASRVPVAATATYPYDFRLFNPAQ